MKIRSLLLLVTAFFTIGTLSSCEKETILLQSDWPAEIISFVETHFPELAILQVATEKEGLKKKYEVKLEGRVSLEFNHKMEIIEIDGYSRLPDSVIPAKILDYVNQNYPENYIIEWELEGKNQQVELDNGLELEFSMSGEFLRIDN